MKTKKHLFKNLPEILWVSLFFIFFTMISCVSNNSKTKSAIADNSDKEAKETVDVLDLECIETAIFIPVDSSIARGIVPREHELYFDSLGAQIIFIAQNCSSAIWNGDDQSSLEKTHVWIRLVGPQVVTPISGVARTLPTFYWWDYSDNTTNNSFYELSNSTAWNMSPMDSIEFNLADHGKVIKNLNGKGQTLLEWFTNPANRSDPYGINHVIYGSNEKGKLYMEASGIIRPVSLGGQSKLFISPNSTLAVFGDELFGKSYDFTMSFKATFKTSLN